MDVGLLDSLLRSRSIKLGYVILRHMLSTLGVNNRLLPYDSIISEILRNFQVPIRDSIYLKTKRINDKAITGIGFYWKNRK